MSFSSRNAIVRIALFAIAIAPLANAQSAQQSAAASTSPIEYELRFAPPQTHLLEITIRASGLRGPAIEFAMPAWAPGWYVINDYAKLVQEFHAATPDGRELRWRKIDKQTWRVDLAGATSVTVRYKLYANMLAVDWSHYDERHAHIAGPSAWMYLVGGKQRPAKLTIDVPAGWRVATGMDSAGASSFTAGNYDVFMDAPIEVSDYAEKTFDFGGSTYHIVVHDILGKKDFSKFAGDTRKAVETLVTMMAPVAAAEGRQAPFKDYWFLFHVWPASGGGLEHLNSTQIFLSGDWANSEEGQPEPGYDGQIGVTAHEFFHAWNVKRMRPRPLGPFDYSREVHTPSLWISEGFTNYYEGVALLRAGVRSPEKYFSDLGGLITFFESRPGRRERSLEDASWDTWFWYVGEGRAPTNRSNTDIDYYGGGEIMGHLLDFAIRNATGNQKSLDEWMRLMYSRFALPKPGFLPEDAIHAANEIAGADLSDFFRRHISGKETPDYEKYFVYAGLRVEKKLDPQRAWSGLETGRAESGARVFAVRAASPAEKAGLSRGDIVTAVDGATGTSGELARMIREATPGQALRLKVTRGGSEREFTITLEPDPNPVYTISPMENPSEMQRRIYESWAGIKK